MGLIADSGSKQLEVKSRVINLSQRVVSQEMLCAEGTSCYKLLWMFEYRPFINSNTAQDTRVLALLSCPRLLRVVQSQEKSRQ